MNQLGLGFPQWARDVVAYTDQMVQADKANNRGVVVASCREVLKISMDHWRITEDPRFLELALRAGDRLTKLLALTEPEGPKVLEGVDTETLIGKVQADLRELESRLQEP